jgi:hypothetical protein
MTLAAAAVSFVTPYLLDFGKDTATEATSHAAKSVWGWIKGKLMSPAGAEALALLASPRTFAVCIDRAAQLS